MAQKTLVVDCKICGREFPSPIQIDPEAFHELKKLGNSYDCPHCGRSDVYEKHDHRYV